MKTLTSIVALIMLFTITLTAGDKKPKGKAKQAAVKYDGDRLLRDLPDMIEYTNGKQKFTMPKIALRNIEMKFDGVAETDKSVWSASGKSFNYGISNGNQSLITYTIDVAYKDDKLLVYEIKRTDQINKDPNYLNQINNIVYMFNSIKRLLVKKDYATIACYLKFPLHFREESKNWDIYKTKEEFLAKPEMLFDERMRRGILESNTSPNISKRGISYTYGYGDNGFGSMNITVDNWQTPIIVGFEKADFTDEDE